MYVFVFIYRHIHVYLHISTSCIWWLFIICLFSGGGKSKVLTKAVGYRNNLPYHSKVNFPLFIWRLTNYVNSSPGKSYILKGYTAGCYSVIINFFPYTLEATISSDVIRNRTDSDLGLQVLFPCGWVAATHIHVAGKPLRVIWELGEKGLLCQSYPSSKVVRLQCLLCNSHSVCKALWGPVWVECALEMEVPFSSKSFPCFTLYPNQPT